MKKKAILVGYQYDNTDDENITRLNGCFKDVDLWSEILDKYNFKSNKFKGKDSKVVLNEFKKLVLSLEKGDVGLAFFSCHGYRKFNHLSYNNYSESIFLGNYYLFDYHINTILRSCLKKEARLILIFDSCHSGGMYKGRDPEFADNQKYISKEVYVPDRGKWYDDFFKKIYHLFKPLRSLKNVTFINACEMEYKAYERKYENGWNGLFSYHAKKVLDKNKKITYKCFEQMIKKSIAEEDTKQIPIIITLDQEKSIFT